ncbi:30S ribosomal protein S19e [Halovenus rubra]|uniref:Small ribosomal subunit protein eS19 n=2 Tax=Halovenus rubra TaxID=869890 RepID=A0ABD5XCW9_9EURY|nr:30S ribosomal protein S19e [Halovenus rubra]
MTSLYDAPAEDVIEALTETLQAQAAIEEPEWLQFTTTGVDRELPPEQEDFWSRRAASLLRKVAIDGPVGVGSLKAEYGSAKQGTTRYRVRPRNKSDGSGNIVRTILQQLEEAGYVEVAEGEGRTVTADGHSLLDETAADVLESLDDPALQRYA